MNESGDVAVKANDIFTNIQEDTMSPLTFEIGEVLSDDEFPGMAQLHDEIFQKPIAVDRITQLRNRYYPDASYEEIALIEHAMEYSFKKFQQYSRWTYSATNQQPGIADYNLDTTSSLSDRLQVINKINAIGSYGAAFATLKEVDSYLAIPGELAIADHIVKTAQSSNPYIVLDIGCGGQAADIQLITDARLANDDVRVVGVGAYDYGEELRKGFPELSNRISFESKNVFLDLLPQQADFVFSVRTIPYTGIIDAVRFCETASAACKPEGTVWISNIERQCFDFGGTEFKSMVIIFIICKTTCHPCDIVRMELTIPFVGINEMDRHSRI